MHPETGTRGEPYPYLRNLAVATATILLLLLGAIVIVDPYGLYRIVDQPGFNRIKPGLARYQEQIKLEHALHKRTPNVILGNSRAEIGFDPASPALRGISPRFYNLAVPGSSIATGLRQIAAMNSAGIPLRTVVVGIEFLDFIGASAPPTSAVSAPVKTPGSILLDAWRWRFDTLFSLATVKDAWKTLRIQHDPETETLSDDGYNPLNEYRKFVRNDGYHAIFQQRALENARTYVRKSRDVLDSGEFDALSTLLEESSKHPSRTVLIIYPYHAQIMFMFEEAGLSPLFMTWKTRVASIVTAAQRKHPDRVIELFDYSGFGATCTVIPANGTREVDSPLYWEGGHFKKAMGDGMLAEIFAQPAISKNATFRNLDRQLGDGPFQLDETRNAARLKVERATCLQKNPELAVDAHVMVAAARAAQQIVKSDFKN